MTFDETRRPASVFCAVILLWAWLAIGFVAGVLKVATWVEENLAAHRISPQISVAVGLSIMIGVSSFLIVQIATGRNWARIALVLWQAAGLLFAHRAYWRGPMEILLGCMLVVATLLLFLPASNGWYRLMRTAGYPRKSVLSMGVRARVIGSSIGFPLLLVVAFALRHAIVASMLIMLVAIWVASQIGSAKCPSCGTRIASGFTWPPKSCRNCHELL